MMMLYANIVIDSKTNLNQPFYSYSIPNDIKSSIKPGVLVEIIFNNRKSQGVIFEIISEIDNTIKSKIKPILRILDINPVLSTNQIMLAKWISDYCLSPLGKVVFTMIPKQAKRSVINESFKNAKPVKSNKKSAFFALIDSKPNRVNYYLKLAEKALRNSKNCILIFPNLEILGYVYKIFCKKFSDNFIVVYHSRQTTTEKYNIWNQIRFGSRKIILSTRPGIFAPINDLGLIIVDDPANFSYKENQSPRYNSVIVAEKFAEITGANLVLGDSTPDLELFNKINVGIYHKISVDDTHEETNIRVSVADLNQNKSKIISWQLEESINNYLSNNKKICLFATRKGEGSSFICRDCGHNFLCKKCKIPLVPISNDSNITKLICKNCNNEELAPSNCPHCSSIRLSSTGIGLQKIEKEIKKLFPDIKLLIVDKGFTDYYKLINNNWQIVIATKKILDFYDFQSDLVGIINLDGISNIPDYSINEKIWALVQNLKGIAKEKFIIQTYNPENAMWLSISNNNDAAWLKNELESRRISNLPPFVNFVKLIIIEKNYKKRELQMNNLVKSLSDFEILGPTEIISKKSFVMQVIVKIHGEIEKSRLKKIFVKFEKNVKIDIDPTNLI